MNIYFSENAGKIYDLFISIWMACNKDSYYKELDDLNISIDKDFINLIEEVCNIIGDDLIKYRKFFNGINMSNSLINIESIYNSISLDEFLNSLNLNDNIEIKKKLITYTNSIGYNNSNLIEDSMLTELINDNIKLYNYIDKSNCTNEDKWNILYAINNTDTFKNEFIKLIKEYTPKYEKLISKYSNEIQSNINVLQNKMTDKDYISSTPIIQFINKENMENIFIIPSFFNAYTLSEYLVSDKNTTYLILGKYIDEIFSNSNRQSQVDKFVSIFKNLGDLNRYTFIKILSSGEKYGQELASILNITSATVNYHATNLLLSNLISMKRIENKTYYSLNKKELTDMIEFIKKDLSL